MMCSFSILKTKDMDTLPIYYIVSPDSTHLQQILTYYSRIISNWLEQNGAEWDWNLQKGCHETKTRN